MWIALTATVAAPLEALEGERHELARRRERHGGVESHAGILRRFAGPRGPHPQGELAVVGLPRERVHGAAPVPRHLDREVGRGAEPEEAEAPARSDPRQDAATDSR